jgi:hypothetical protein
VRAARAAFDRRRKVGSSQVAADVSMNVDEAEVDEETGRSVPSTTTDVQSGNPDSESSSGEESEGEEDAQDIVELSRLPAPKRARVHVSEVLVPSRVVSSSMFSSYSSWYLFQTFRLHWLARGVPGMAGHATGTRPVLVLPVGTAR